MPTTTTRKPVTRHRCGSAVSAQCSRGTGKGPSKCRYCGSGVVTQTGLYGVFVWRGDGRYPASDAITLRRTESSADKACEADGRYVTRWVGINA